MPFKSQSQAKFLYAKHPAVAKKWAEHTKGPLKKLPEKVVKTVKDKTAKK